MKKDLNEMYLDLENVSRNGSMLSCVPTFFLEVNNDVDLESLMNNIVNKVESLNLVKFSKENKSLYHDYLFNEDERFTSFIDFFYVYKNKLCKFNIPYQGILFINVSEWANKNDLEELRMLAAFISKVDEGLLTFFISSSNSNDSLLDCLNQELWVEEIEAKKDLKTQLVEKFYQLCNSFNYKVDEQAKNGLNNFIDKIIASNKNNALKALTKSLGKVIYKKSKSVLNQSKIINLNDINEIVKDQNLKNDVYRMF